VLLRPLTVLKKQTRQAVCAIKQSIFLDVYGCHSYLVCNYKSEYIQIVYFQPNEDFEDKTLLKKDVE